MLRTLLFGFLLIPSVWAYENPPFEGTPFTEDYGTFRWYRGCWWKVHDPFEPYFCLPPGVDPFAYFPGSGLPGTSPGPSVEGEFGFSLGDSSFGSLDFSGLGNGINLPSFSTDGGFGIFQFDAEGNLISRSGGSDDNDDSDSEGSSILDRIRSRHGGSGGGGIFGGDDGGESGGGFSFGDDDEDRGRTSILSRDGGGFFSGGFREGPAILRQPLFGRCESIHDGRETESLGEVPCTTYPSIFGPVPRY